MHVILGFFYLTKMFSLAVQPEEGHNCSFLLPWLPEPCCRCWQGTGSAISRSISAGKVPGGAAGAHAESESLGKRRSKRGKTCTSGDLGHHRPGAGGTALHSSPGSPPPPFSSPPEAAVDPRPGSPPAGWRRKAGKGGHGKPSLPGRPRWWQQPLRAARPARSILRKT